MNFLKYQKVQGPYKFFSLTNKTNFDCYRLSLIGRWFFHSRWPNPTNQDQTSWKHQKPEGNVEVAVSSSWYFHQFQVLWKTLFWNQKSSKRNYSIAQSKNQPCDLLAEKDTFQTHQLEDFWSWHGFDPMLQLVPWNVRPIKTGHQCQVLECGTARRSQKNPTSWRGTQKRPANRTFSRNSFNEF